ncbi:TPA: M20/M25/M40 family metallo-hydrolase, partial [Candidatus Bipolaricaulota bacterium]|nr:M20/M25/M40 family metallo-hydrolase [Candidatus Bipolaricaulota bacterium]
PLEEWSSDPFSAEVREGRLFARGAADNKGNIIARLAAVEAYLKVYGELPLGVKFIIEGEEEIGSPHLGEFAEVHPGLVQADGYIWEFGYKDLKERPHLYLGLKGILYVELRATGAKRDLHSSWGTVVPNPAWRLTWALNTLKGEDEKVLIPGFYDKVRPLSPEEREVLAGLDFDEEGWREQLGLGKYLLNLAGEELLEHHLFRPTCTICGLRSGYLGPGSKTVLPHEAQAKIDFRLVPDQDPEEILNLLKDHLSARGFSETEIEVIPHSWEPPARTPPEDPLVKTVIAAARRAYEKEPQVYPISPGSGPMYSLCQRFGIPAVSTGVGYWGSNAHGPNENIRLDDLAQGMKHIALIIQEFALA